MEILITNIWDNNVQLKKALSCFNTTIPPCTKLSKNCVSQFDVDEADWPVQSMNSTLANTFGMNWNARSYHPKSVPDLADTVVTGWEQLPAARIQNLVESLTRKVELHINTHHFENHDHLVVHIPLALNHLLFSVSAFSKKCIPRTAQPKLLWKKLRWSL